MDKIELIEEYIDNCDVVLHNKNQRHAEDLEDDILGVFSGEIDNIRERLDLYHAVSGVDHLKDISLLRQKLINYKMNLLEEEKKREYELELARLKQPSVTNVASAHQTQTTTIDVKIDIEQTIKQVEEIPTEILSFDDKEKLKEYLYSLEGIKASKNKNLFWEKTKDVFKFLADKGADAAIAMLPYIIQGLSNLN